MRRQMASGCNGTISRLLFGFYPAARHTVSARFPFSFFTFSRCVHFDGGDQMEPVASLSHASPCSQCAIRLGSCCVVLDAQSLVSRKFQRVASILMPRVTLPIPTQKPEQRPLLLPTAHPFRIHRCTFHRHHNRHQRNLLVRRSPPLPPLQQPNRWFRRASNSRIGTGTNRFDTDSLARSC
jgi:hypothetical protein